MRLPRALAFLVALGVSACTSAPPARSSPSREVEPAMGAVQRGLASWYGAEFADLPTASGEIFRPDRISAAHRTLPLGTLVEVRNESNGRTVSVRINDRGPFIAGRIVDLSKAAAHEIGAVADGVVPVTLTVVALGRNERASPVSASGWVVQVGAFASDENAKRLRDRLAESYPDPFLEEFRGLTRVKFGPYPTRAAAETASRSLESLGLAGIVGPHRP